MKSKLNKMLGFFLRVVFVFLIIVGIVVGWTLVPIKNNIKILAVTSGSMDPEIKTGSVILIKPYSDYSVGDVITFNPPVERKAKDYTTHRIVEIKENSGGEISYITKGDANDAKDVVPVQKKRVVGKKIISVPLIGYIVGYAKTLPGLIVIIALAAIIAYEEIKKIFSEVGKMRSAKKNKINNNKVKKEGKRKAGKDDEKT